MKRPASLRKRAAKARRILRAWFQFQLSPAPGEAVPAVVEREDRGPVARMVPGARRHGQASPK